MPCPREAVTRQTASFLFMRLGAFANTPEPGFGIVNLCDRENG